MESTRTKKEKKKKERKKKHQNNPLDSSQKENKRANWKFPLHPRFRGTLP